MMTHVLFRTDAGPSIGLGHLQRCLSLAAALRRAGASCVFCVTREETAMRRVSDAGFAVHPVDCEDPYRLKDAAVVGGVAARYGCGVVIVDSYAAGEAYLSQLRASGLFVAFIDDLAHDAFPCQLVVNGSLHATRLAYRSSSGDTRFLLGSKYTLLRPEFWEPVPRRVREHVEQVLVTVGGADPLNLLPRLLAMLELVPDPCTITVMAGPFVTNVGSLEQQAAASRHVVRVVHGPERVRDLMLEADVAISAAGQTLYELAAAGMPTIAMETAENQRGQLAVFVEREAVCSVGDARKDGVAARTKEGLMRLLADRHERARLSAAAQGLIDGRGAWRVAEALLQNAASALPSTATGRNGCAMDTAVTS